MFMLIEGPDSADSGIRAGVHAPGLQEAERLELRERRFEDKATKALVNVLEHGRLQASFLAEVLDRPARQPPAEPSPVPSS